MDVTTLPFNRLLGLQRGAEDAGTLVSLPASDQYANHLGSVHAGALLAVAEAGSAEFLLRHFGAVDGVVPVVRRLDAKFRRPAHGRVSARAAVDEGALGRLTADLQAKGRALIGVSVEVVDEDGVVVLTATVEWFVARAA